MCKQTSPGALPDQSQIRAEIKEAEAEGIHKRPVDMLDEVNEAITESGHFDDTLRPRIEPTIEDLTR